MVRSPGFGVCMSNLDAGIVKKALFEKFDSIGRIQKGFEGTGYICSQQIATILYLAFQFRQTRAGGRAGWGWQNRAGQDERGLSWFTPEAPLSSPLHPLSGT